VSVTQEEMRLALAALKMWPKERREELLLMQPNEREMAMLLVAYLGARPVA
jgi:hypothetical protein